MIRIDHLTKTFPDKTLFRDGTVQLSPGMRVGLVGANGSGKTTLLRMLLGAEHPDEGQISIDNKVSMGYLPQEIIPQSESSVLAFVLGHFPEIQTLENRILTLSDKLAEYPDKQQLLTQLGEAQHAFERLGGYSMEENARKILSGLGFPPGDETRSMKSFSGGWRMRAALGALLLQSPDYLLLDEPTNHLDLEALIWLEEFLDTWSGGLILISHDRVFLDKTVHHILEIERGHMTLFRGNFTAYREEKQSRIELQRAAWQNQQKKIVEIERFIARFRYKDSKASQVQSRVKMLEKMERIEEPVESKPTWRLRLPQPGRAPQKIAVLEKVDKAYGENCVYQNLDLILERGLKVGLVGPNGSGKSTLLKLLADVEAPTGGKIIRGKQVNHAYFAQHQLEILDPDKTVLGTVLEEAPDWTISDVRSYLGQYLFTGDTVEKLVRVLSGGEKSRLALARMLVNPAHVLYLDEPTNHLDMAARDIIERVLSEFQGTLVCISHDRHFMNRVTNRIWEIQEGAIAEYHGNYDYYEWKREQTDGYISRTDLQSKKDRDDIHPESGKPPGKSGLSYRERKRMKNRLQKLQRKMIDLETTLGDLMELTENPEDPTDYEALQAVQKRLAETEASYLQFLEEAERLGKRLSG